MRWAFIMAWVCAGGILTPAVAQCPATDFNLAASACLNEQLLPVNVSGPGSYSWDFCSGDFSATPSAVSGWNLPGVNGRPGIDFAFDGKWYAFVTGTFSNLLYRLEFDNGLESSPTSITNLGSLGGALDQPGQIRLVREGGQWYGLLHNTGGSLLKLSFGSALGNVPGATVLISGIGYVNSGLAVGRDAVHGYVAAVTEATNQVALIRLGLGIAAPNPVTDVLRSAAVPNPNNLGDIDLVNVCGNWFGLAASFGNANIYRFDFGTSLFAVPTITQLATLSASNPGRIRVAREGENYFFFALALDGSFTKGSFGADITAMPVISGEGALSGVLPSGMYALSLVKENSTWTILGISQSSGQCFRINYTMNCSASPAAFTGSDPVVTYSTAGTYQIALENQAGEVVGVRSRSISVNASPAPDISFSTTGTCAAAPVQFNSINTSGNLVGYAWDFGDGQVSGASNPAHTYGSPGTYISRLLVTASNGCTNTASNSITIFSPPVPDFSLPAAAPVCTNEEYTFLNSSVFNPASNPAWEWRVNGNLVGTQQNLSITLANPVLHEIRLRASIPGCDNEMVKTIPTVVTGPLVSFSAADDCAENAVPFINTTSGADAGYSWNFGDGSPASTQQQPAHAYTAPGTYSVTLTASNAAGCNNSATQDITIFSLPQPAFSVAAPPFSCSNSPTLFQNLTPPLTDSNVSDWLWSFDDPSSTTSSAQQPSFTYTSASTFSVSLTATSDAGCSNTVIQPVTILASPVANFVLGPACVGTATQFSDVSTGGVQSRIWQIGGSTFTSPNPTYTYTAAGNYTATLTVTSTNGCTHTLSRSVNVPVPPTLTLQVENACAGQPAIFTLFDATLPPAADPATNWQWSIGGTTTVGNPATTTLALAENAPVSVITTHASGCTYTQFHSVTIHPSPTADFIAAPDRGDAPLTVQFQNLSAGASQYEWLINDKVPVTSTVVSPIHTFLELGDYSTQLTVTNGYGCSDSKTLPIQVLVPQIDLQVTSFSLFPDAATGKLRPSLTIFNNSNIPVASVEVVLLLSSRASVSEALAVNLSPGASVTKALTATVDPSQFADPFVCVQAISERDIAPDNNKSCINFSDQDYLFDPYPNPSTGQLQLDWVSGQEGWASVTIYDSQGRVNYSWETPSQPGLNRSTHDLSFLGAGIYLVTVRTSTSVQTRRIVRQ